MKQTYVVLLFTLIILSVFSVLAVSVRRTERAECMSWKQEKPQWDRMGYVPQDWQIAQCEARSITLN